MSYHNLYLAELEMEMHVKDALSEAEQRRLLRTVQGAKAGIMVARLLSFVIAKLSWSAGLAKTALEMVRL